MRIRLFSWMFGFWLSLIPQFSHAEPQQSASEGERRISVQLAELQEKQAEKKFNSHQSLYSAGLISKSELDSSNAEYVRYKLEALKARLTLNNELPSFHIISAIKSTGKNGEIFVNIVLQELRAAEDENYSKGYLISLKAGNSIISEPYQQSITVAGVSKEKINISFRLLKDADELAILIASGARKEEVPVLLQRDSRVNLRMTSASFSLEAALGDKAEFPIEIERFNTNIRGLDLKVKGLPTDYSYEWVDSETKAKLNRVRFLEGRNVFKLNLRVFVPAIGPQLVLGKSNIFKIEAEPEGNYLGGEKVDQLELQITPTGIPKLIISTDNFLVQMNRSESIDVHFVVENLGNEEAKNVQLNITTPIGIQVSTTPSSISKIAFGSKQIVTMKISPQTDSVVGEYNLKIQAIAENRLKSIESPEQTIRVVLKGAQTAMIYGILLFVISIGTVFGIYWGVKHARK